ncbi:MAG: hypothetical protein QM764_16185 [Chitinophagaceae bacterium]
MLRSIVVFVFVLFYANNNYSQDAGVGFVTTSDNEYVYLRWQLTDSTHFQYFTVEKSDNGVQWRTLDTVAWNENVPSYAYTDSFPAEGVNYYRIKANTEEKSVYSISRRAYVGVVDNLVTVYPNPVNQNLRFEMSALLKGRYQALVFSSAGVRIAAQLIDHDGKDKVRNYTVADLNQPRHLLDSVDDKK